MVISAIEIFVFRHKKTGNAQSSGAGVVGFFAVKFQVGSDGLGYLKTNISIAEITIFMQTHIGHLWCTPS